MSSPHLAGLAATSETKTPGTEKVGELYVPDKSQLERFAAARDAVGGDDPWRNFEGPQVAPPWQEPRSMADAMSGLDAMRDLRWWTDFAGRLNLAHAATEMPEALKSYLKWGVENLDYPPAFVQEIPQLVDMVRSGLHTAKVLPSYFPDVSVPDAKHPTPMESLDYLANVLVPGYSLGTQWENMTSMERGVHIAADSLLTFILLRVGASLAKGAKGGSGQGQLVKQTTPSLISRRVLMKTIQAQAEGTPRYRPGALGQGPWPSRAGGAPKVGVQGYRPGALGQGPWPSRAGGPSILGLKGRWRSPSGALGQGPWPSRPGGPSILGLKGRWRSSSGALGQGPRRYRPGALGKPRLGPPASDSGPRVTQERLAWEERVRQRAAAEEEMLRRPGGLAEYQKLHQSREAQRLLDIREDAIRKRLQESPSRATAVLDNPSRVPELSGPGAVKDAELLLQELSKQRGIQAAEQVLKDLAKQRASKLASRRAHMAAMQGQVEGAGPYRPRVKRQFAENSKAGGDIIDRSIAEGGPEGTLIAPPLAAALHQEPQARRPDDGRTVEGHPSGVPGPQLDDAIGAPASEPTQKPDDDMALPLQDTGILLGGAPLARMSQGSTKPESGSRASPKDDPSFQPGSVPYVHPADTGTDTEKGADGQNTEPAIVPYVDPADTGADTDTGTGADDETVTEPNTEPAIFPYVDPADTGADTDTGTGADDDTDTGTDDETVTEPNTEPAIVPYVDPADTDIGTDDDTDTGTDDATDTDTSTGTDDDTDTDTGTDDDTDTGTDDDTDTDTSTGTDDDTDTGTDDDTDTDTGTDDDTDTDTSTGTDDDTDTDTSTGTDDDTDTDTGTDDDTDTDTDTGTDDETVTGPAPKPGPTPGPKLGTTPGRTTNRRVRTRLRRKPGKPPPIKGKRGLRKLGRATDGIFPKVVAWRSGFGYTTHNLRTGKTKFDDERPDGALEVSGPGAARKSFSVLEKGTTPPTQRQLDKGIMEVHIGPDGPRHRLKRGRGKGRRRR